jgi:hypothetical protein
MIIQKVFKLTWTTSSIRLTSKTPGTKPAPIPWILWGPEHSQWQIEYYPQRKTKVIDLNHRALFEIKTVKTMSTIWRKTK